MYLKISRSLITENVLTTSMSSGLSSFASSIILFVIPYAFCNFSIAVITAWASLVPKTNKIKKSYGES